MLTAFIVGICLLFSCTCDAAASLRPWRLHARRLAEAALVVLGLTGTANSAIPSIDEFYVTSGTKIRSPPTASSTPKATQVLDVVNLREDRDGGLTRVEGLRRLISVAR